MTPGRAAVVELLDRYLLGLLDPFVTLLDAHKLMYFMQAAGEPLKLKFTKGHYGPYAEDLRHVLHAIEGHFVTGYADGGDAPDRQLRLVVGALEDARTVLADKADTQKRLESATDLIDGFESPFGLELLSARTVRDDQVLRRARPLLRPDRMSKFYMANLCSGLNNLHDITLNARFSAICGFAAEDLDTMFAPELPGLDRERIRGWYNGYSWGGEERVYNPFDVLLLLAEREFKVWWFETGTPTFAVDSLVERGVPSPALDGWTWRCGGRVRVPVRVQGAGEGVSRGGDVAAEEAGLCGQVPPPGQCRWSSARRRVTWRASRRSWPEREGFGRRHSAVIVPTGDAVGWRMETGRAQGGGFPRMAPRGDGLARARARKY